MKTFKTFFSETKKTLTKDEIRPHVWKSWKQDPFMAPKEEHWNELNADDHDEFEHHVNDVHRHATQHGITNVRKAFTSHYRVVEKQAHERIKSDVKEYAKKHNLKGTHEEILRHMVSSVTGKKIH